MDPGESEFEVECIVGYRVVYGRIAYLVKWMGYPASENTWEPPHHLTNAMEAVVTFHVQSQLPMPPHSMFQAPADPEQ